MIYHFTTAILLISVPAFAFLPFIPTQQTYRPKWCSVLLRTSIDEEQQAITAESEKTTEEVKPLYYDNFGEWVKRIDFSELKFGQKILGVKLDKDILDGKTGPKLFFDCGVARFNPAKNKYAIVNAMLRLGKKFDKKSVTQKRASRLGKKKSVELYVSKIRKDNFQFEVSLQEPIYDNNGKKIPASTLVPKQELVGVVKRIEPYGVFVDVGANRLGLLHIKRVADLYQMYINKEKGLVKAGLERGAQIKVQVLTNESKRMFLDFTDDVKAEAAAEYEKESNKKNINVVVENEEESEYDISEDEAAAWAEFAAGGSNDEDDEDTRIEDALGLGSY